MSKLLDKLLDEITPDMQEETNRKLIYFSKGFEEKESRDKKLILDLLNKYRLKYSDETRTKLAKRISPEEVLRLESKIEVLKEIQSKL